MDATTGGGTDFRKNNMWASLAMLAKDITAGMPHWNSLGGTQCRVPPDYNEKAVV